MLKLAILACVCAAVLVEGQDLPPPPPPGGPPPSGATAPSGATSVEGVPQSRVARQAMPQMPAGMPSMQDMTGGNPGNLAMQGLGNIPDPTAWIAKGQEMGRQLMSGRRRRQAGLPEAPVAVPSTGVPLN